MNKKSFHGRSMATVGCTGGNRRLLDTSAAPAGDDGAAHGSPSSPDTMSIMVGVLVTVVFCTLLYCIYCWRWRKRNGKQIQLVNR